MPAKFRIFHVVHNKDANVWMIEIENSRIKLNGNSYKTKKEAVERAKAMAKCQVIGQVIIHRKDGTIQKERSYMRDPMKYPS